MIQKIKATLARIKQRREQKQQLLKAQKYYKILRQGALFLQYINNDLEKQKKQNMNRPQRRRWEKEIHKKGKFSPEMIDNYKSHVELILKQIDLQMNPPKPGKIKFDKEKFAQAMKDKKANVKAS